MKIEIKTKTTCIPDELLKPFSKNLITETGHGGYIDLTFEYYRVATLYLDMRCTEKISRYCASCGCEPYATLPKPNYSIITTQGYDNDAGGYAWKQRAKIALKPYYDREKKFKELSEVLRQERLEVSRMPCPVCGGELSFGKNGNVEIYESYKRVEHFAAACDVPVQVSANAEAVEAIKASTERLQEYLLNIIKIEKSIRSVKQRLLVLYSLSYEVNRNAKFAQLYPIMSEKKTMTEAIDRMQSEFRTRANELSELQRCRDRLSADKIVCPAVPFPIQPIEPTKPVYATPNFFNKKRIAAENEEKARKYNNEIMLYNKAIAEYPALVDAAKKQQEDLHKKAVEDREREIRAFDEEIAAKTAALKDFEKKLEEEQAALEDRIVQLQNNVDYPAVQLKINLDREISTAEGLLSDLFTKKHQLYGVGIIFGKYRDLAAITSFYEYLLSGRCETLDGANGCYNLYEAELRANIIINRLDEIGDSLECIKSNQYMLYSQLSEINTELSALNAATTAMLNGLRGTAEVFLEHSAVIAHNSAVSAYYSKVNAEIASSARYISMICW